MTFPAQAWRGRAARLWFVLAAGIALVSSSRGQLSIDGLVTSLGGGVFRYDFSVTNNGLLDVTLASLVDAPIGDGLIAQTLAVPAGFVGSYDPNLGIVDFLEGADIFAAGTTKGLFQFQSTGSPVMFFNSFEALDVDANLLTGQVKLSGNIRPVPEASTVWAAAGLLALVLALRIIPRRIGSPLNIREAS